MGAAVTTLLTIAMITKEATAVLHDKLALAKKATRRYEGEFGNKAAQIGNSVSIRKPAKYAVGTTADVSSLANVTEEDFVTLTCDQRRNVLMNFTSLDLALSIGDFRTQFLNPAISRLVREVELQGFKQLKTTPQIRYGRTVTGALTFLDYTKMNAILTTRLMPEEGRSLYASAMDQADVVNANKGLFQDATELSKQYRMGYMGMSGGFAWIGSENTQGITWASAIPVAGTLTATAAQEAVNLAVTGMGNAAIVKAGTAYTVAGVYAIDPETQEQLGYLYTFIAASDVTLNASGVGTIVTTTKMRTTAESITKATISALPQSGAAITPVEVGSVASKTGRMVYGIQDGAVALATIELATPPESGTSAYESFEGIGVRVWNFSNGLTDTIKTRIDIQFGWCVDLMPEGIVSTVGIVA